MNARLTALPGGRDLHPHAAHIVSPARRKFARDLTAATTNIAAARSHVDNLRPSQPTTMLPLELSLHDVTLLIAALGQHGLAPSLAAIAERISGQVHPSLLPAWADRDTCPPHGIERPVTL